MIITFKQFIDEMADTSRALSTETKLNQHLQNYGLTAAGRQSAGFSNKGKDVEIQHPKRKQTIATEVKDNAKGAKLVSFALRYIKKEGEKTGRWDIPENKRKEKPKAAAEFDKATVTHADGSQSSLSDHINKTYGEPKVGKHLSSIRSDLTDMSPAHANYQDKGIDVLHIQDKGTFRTGHSHKKDRHGTGLPSLNGNGQWVVATERKRTERNQREGTGMQVNFRPVAKSIEKSNIDISTDEGAKALRQNLSKKKKAEK